MSKYRSLESAPLLHLRRFVSAAATYINISLAYISVNNFFNIFFLTLFAIRKTCKCAPFNYRKAILLFCICECLDHKGKRKISNLISFFVVFIFLYMSSLFLLVPIVLKIIAFFWLTYLISKSFGELLFKILIPLFPDILWHFTRKLYPAWFD